MYHWRSDINRQRMADLPGLSVPSELRALRDTELTVNCQRAAVNWLPRNEAAGPGRVQQAMAGWWAGRLTAHRDAMAGYVMM
jgi:hypothetical protein